MSETQFERIVELNGAFDRRHSDPAKNYGIHGMDLLFVLKGPKGAVQFVVYTQMHLPHVAAKLWRKTDRRYNPFEPMGADIGYHSAVPRHEGQEPSQSACKYLHGAPCYYDGSSLQADEFMPTFLALGSDAVWQMLEERYRMWLDPIEESTHA